MSSKFPKLFELEKKKSAFVAERMIGNQPVWNWKRRNLDPGESYELTELLGIISQYPTSAGPDIWKAKMAGDGNFRVHDIRQSINTLITRPVQNPTV